MERLANTGKGCYVLFIVEGPVDTGSAFYKALVPLADVSACEAVTEKNIMFHVDTYLKKYGFTLTAEARGLMTEMFHTWSTLSLLYVFSELDKLAIDPDRKRISADDLEGLFAGTAEKNLFTFGEYFLFRNGEGCIPLMKSLFAKTEGFMKSTAYLMSRLRMLRSYAELVANNKDKATVELLMTKINNGRPVRGSLYYLQKYLKYWTIKELDTLICDLFTLQLRMRRGNAVQEDAEALICLYCSKSVKKNR